MEKLRSERLETSWGGRIGRITQDGNDTREGREEGDEAGVLRIDRRIEGEQKTEQGEGQLLGF